MGNDHTPAPDAQSRIIDKVSAALGTKFRMRDSSYWSSFFYEGAPTEQFTAILLSQNHDPQDDCAIYSEFPVGAFVLDVSYVGAHPDAATVIESLGNVTILRQK